MYIRGGVVKGRRPVVILRRRWLECGLTSYVMLVRVLFLFNCMWWLRGGGGGYVLDNSD
jgi:hypothetical protein